MALFLFFFLQNLFCTDIALKKMKLQMLLNILIEDRQEVQSMKKDLKNFKIAFEGLESTIRGQYEETAEISKAKVDLLSDIKSLEKNIKVYDDSCGLSDTD